MPPVRIARPRVVRPLVTGLVAAASLAGPATTWAAEVLIAPSRGDAVASGAALADLDGDGLDDVVVPLGRRGLGVVRGGALRARVAVRAGAAGGALTLAGSPSTARLAAGVGDWNGDGREDVAVVAGAGDRIAVLGLGWAGVRWVAPAPVAGVEAAGDVNGDGAADVLAFSGRGDAWVVFGGRPAADLVLDRLGDAGLTMAVEVELRNDDPNAAVTAVATGDVNGDGPADIAFVVRRRSTGELALVRGHRTSGSVRVRPSDTSDTPVFAVRPLGDVTGDGIADVATRGADGWRRLAGGPGLGADAVPPTPSTPMLSGGQVEDLRVVGDTDGDGGADVVVTGGLGRDGRTAGRRIAATVPVGALTGPGPARAVVDASRDVLTCPMLGLVCDGSGRPNVAAHGDVNGDGLVDVVLRVEALPAAVLVVHLGARAPTVFYAPGDAWVGERLGGRDAACLVPAVRGPAPASFAVAGRLPAGLRLDARSGAICGVPARPASRRPYRVSTVGQAPATATVLLRVHPRDRRAPRVRLVPGRLVAGLPSASGSFAVRCSPPERSCTVRSLQVRHRASGRRVPATVLPSDHPRRLTSVVVIRVPSRLADEGAFAVRAVVADAAGNRTRVERTLTLRPCVPAGDGPTDGDACA